MACEETDALHGQHIVELKTLQEVDIAGSSDSGGGCVKMRGGVHGSKLRDGLSDFMRQMAVSLMALHVSFPLHLCVSVCWMGI